VLAGVAEQERAEVGVEEQVEALESERVVVVAEAGEPEQVVAEAGEPALESAVWEPGQAAGRISQGREA